MPREAGRVRPPRRSSRDRPNCTVWVIERGDPAVAFGHDIRQPFAADFGKAQLHVVHGWCDFFKRCASVLDVVGVNRLNRGDIGGGCVAQPVRRAGGR